jgi:hypothetical protein
MFLLKARREIARRGTDRALTALGRLEPVLAAFLAEGLAAIAGKFALWGAPLSAVRGSHEEMLALALTCLQALRRGHFELWRDTMSDTRLAQLDPSLRARPRRRRRKRPDAGPDNG